MVDSVVDKAQALLRANDSPDLHNYLSQILTQYEELQTKAKVR